MREMTAQDLRNIVEEANPRLNRTAPRLTRFDRESFISSSRAFLPTDEEIDDFIMVRLTDPRACSLLRQDRPRFGPSARSRSGAGATSATIPGLAYGDFALASGGSAPTQLATLAQAIKSTRPTAPISNQSASLMSPISCSSKGTVRTVKLKLR